MKLSRLEKFLINRNLISNFEHNLKHYCINEDITTIKSLLERQPRDKLILHSFSWGLGREGYEFWQAINNEWRKSLLNDTL